VEWSGVEVCLYLVAKARWTRGVQDGGGRKEEEGEKQDTVVWYSRLGVRTLITGEDEPAESLSRQTSTRSKHLLPQVPYTIGTVIALEGCRSWPPYCNQCSDEALSDHHHSSGLGMRRKQCYCWFLRLKVWLRDVHQLEFSPHMLTSQSLHVSQAFHFSSQLLPRDLP